MNIFVKCPNCGGELQVTSAVGLEEKNATCPQCKQPNKIKDFLPKLSWRVGDRNYQLRFGCQWVGRKKEGNDAEVQIPDDSRYMSKKHAIMELKCTAAGVECTFEEHGKNPTSKEGITLVEDDIIFLNINDCLTLGTTKMYLANEYE